MGAWTYETTTHEASERNLRNAALLTDGLLLEAASVVGNAGRVNPSTMHALNSLTEATVLHEFVYCGLHSTFGQPHPLVENSEIMRQLAKEKVLGQPTIHWLSGLKTGEFDIADLMDNVVGVGLDDEHELANIGLLTDIASRMSFLDFQDPDRIRAQYGVSLGSTSRAAQVDDMSLYSRFRQLFAGTEPPSPLDVAVVHELTRKCRGYWTLAQALDLQIYPSLLEIPVFLALFRDPRCGPPETVRLMKNELRLDGWFERMAVPPFLSLVLRDTPERFGSGLLQLRERHAGFRGALTELKTSWANAATVGEQRDLYVRFRDAWRGLMSREDRVVRTRVSHVVAKGILSFGKSLMDTAIEFDRDQQAIVRVQGIVDLWKDLESAPSIERSRDLMNAAYPGRVAAQEHWVRISQLVRPFEGMLT
jgi:hypothetical protein